MGLGICLTLDVNCKRECIVDDDNKRPHVGRGNTYKKTRIKMKKKTKGLTRVLS